MNPHALPSQVLHVVRACAWWFVFLAAPLRGDEPRMEKLSLPGGAQPEAWKAIESTEDASTDVVREGAGLSLHWHIPVDYFAGEPKYPVGWPRLILTLTGADRDWTAWDGLHFWIHTRTSRPALPRVPAAFSIRTGPEGRVLLSRVLADLEKDRWTEVTIPFSPLAPGGVSPGWDVRALQFNISEDHYRHGDTLDFYIADLSLRRHTVPTLSDFTPVNTLMFSDVRAVPVSFTLFGIKPGEQRPVTLRLRHEGAVLAEQVFAAGRGPQRFVLDVDKLTLMPGWHELEGSVEGGGADVTSRLRVIASPWRSASR